MNAAYFLVDKNAIERPNNVAIYYKDKKLTYAELHANVNRFGNALKNLGVKKGERFVCRMPNRPEAAIIFIAGVKIGAIPIPSFPLLKENELEYIVNITDSVGIVSNSESLDEIKDIWNKCKTLRFIISVGENKLANYTYENLVESSPSVLEPEKTDKDDIALICFTSGTTGKPKGLPHKHKSILAQADIYVPFGLEGLKEGDVIFTTSPFGFVFGLVALVIYPFRFGVSTVYSEKRMEPEDVSEILDRFHVTHFLTIPTLCQKMLKESNARAKYTFPCLRVAKATGMEVPEELQKRWKKAFKVDLLPGFGMQELLGAAISCTSEKFKYGSIGLGVPGMEACVLDKDNQIIATGKQGRLAVKSPSVIPYYWRDPEKTKQYLTEDGWLYTDDIVYQDDEGFFYYVGRSDDVIKSSGWTISPVEIENVLNLHPAVSEAGVFGISDPEKGNIPVAAIVLKKGMASSEGLTLELQGFVKTRLAPYKYPRKIYYVASLPRTVTGKLLRYQLREKFTQCGNLSEEKNLLSVE